MFRSFFSPPLQWRNRLPPSCEGMPQEDITELSDEGCDPKQPLALAVSKPKAKPKSGPSKTTGTKDKALGKPKPKTEKPMKKKEKPEADSESRAHEKDKGKSSRVPEESKDEGQAKKQNKAKAKAVKPAKQDKVLKKPAGVGKKPAASKTAVEGQARKVYKYKYHKDGKWGLKVNGQEQFTVRALCQFVIALCRCLGINFTNHVVPCHAKIKPAEHLTDENLEEMADTSLVIVVYAAPPFVQTIPDQNIFCTLSTENIWERNLLFYKTSDV